MSDVLSTVHVFCADRSVTFLPVYSSFASTYCCAGDKSTRAPWCQTVKYTRVTMGGTLTRDIVVPLDHRVCYLACTTARFACGHAAMHAVVIDAVAIQD